MGNVLERLVGWCQAMSKFKVGQVNVLNTCATSSSGVLAEEAHSTMTSDTATAAEHQGANPIRTEASLACRQCIYKLEYPVI